MTQIEPAQRLSCQITVIMLELRRLPGRRSFMSEMTITRRCPIGLAIVKNMAKKYQNFGDIVCESAQDVQISGGFTVISSWQLNDSFFFLWLNLLKANA